MFTQKLNHIPDQKQPNYIRFLFIIHHYQLHYTSVQCLTASRQKKCHHVFITLLMIKITLKSSISILI